jgi:carbonic anhydrase
VNSKDANAPYLIPNSNVYFIGNEGNITNVTVENITTTIKVFFSDGVLVTWDYTSTLRMFQPIQFHIHAPSEHTFNGKNYDMEVHVVHQEYNTDKLAVLAIFFDTANGGNTDNTFIASLKPGVNNPTASNIPLTDLVNSLDKN